MIYGLGREPNRWDDRDHDDVGHSYEERRRWYEDPYRPSYHDDYYEDDWRNYHPPHSHPRYHYNLAANEEPSKFEETLYQSLFKKSESNKKKS